MESVCDVVEVLRVEASDGNTAVHGHVNGILFAELVDLVLVQAGEGEHANLVDDVAPIVLVAHLLQLVAEAVAHGVHTARHVAQILVPHGGQLRVAQDDVDDAGAVDGRVRVDRSGDLLDAAHHNVFLSLASANSGETAGTLTVKTEVLGERLEQHDVVGVLLEQLQRVAILFKVAGGEALIGAVEG